MITRSTFKSPLEKAARSIHQQLERAPKNYFKPDLDEWCELQGLKRLDDPLETVARQAAFNLLLKSTLYEKYHQRGKLPRLPIRPRKALQRAENVTGDSAFQEYVLDDAAWLADIDDLEDLFRARHRLIASERPTEEIGNLFETLTPQETRRKLGQFRTPTKIADIMAVWITPSGDERVLDPGMGACALSAAAYRSKQEKLEEAALDEIYGADLNKLALVMGSTVLNLLDHGGPHNLRVGDFLELSPEDVDGEIDSIICNPPYSRHHEIPEGYKNKINVQVERELGRDVSALSPMYAYFYYHASKFLTPGGRASFITPSEFLETGYGESLKQYLLDEFDIKALMLFDRGSDSVFDEAMTTSLVSFLEKSDGYSEAGVTRFIRVDTFPGQEELLDAVDDCIEGPTDWGFVNVVRQEELEADKKWTGLFDPLKIDTSRLISLSEFATVKRGIATGANSFFCLSQAQVDEWGIEERYLSPLIRNSRSVPFYDYRKEDWERQCQSGNEVWLLYHLKTLDYQQEPAVRVSTQLSDYRGSSGISSREVSKIVGYLKYGTSDDVKADKSYLARNREPWYVVDRRDPAPVLVTYMSRGGCRFILNETDARNLNNLHGVYFDVRLEMRELKALLAYLNSGFADEVIRRSGRTYSTGMDKIEPNELENVPVLDTRELDDQTVDELAYLFDELCEAARDAEMSKEKILSRIDTSLDEII